MMEQTKLVPKRRFKEFQNAHAWEQRKLRRIAEFNPKAELPETFKYVDLESVVGTEMIAYREERKATAPSRAQRLARQGDLFYQTVRPYQKNNYLFEKPCNNYVFSTGYAQLRPYGDGYFLLSLVQTEQFVKMVLDRCTGTSYPAINSNDLAEMEVSVPLKGDEQIQIGKFFKNLDHLITLHQRKLEKTKALKSAYLSEMFPAEGERVPKRRFAGFTDPWEQRKLGELANFSKGNGYSKGDLVENGYPIILYGRLYVNYETVINVIDTFVDIKANSVISEGNEVIVPASGETAEDISRASVVGKPGIILGGDLNIIKPNSKIDPTFLALTISNGKQQKEMSKRAQGKSVVHLHNSDLKQVNFLYPELKEQQKIGQFFVQLDNFITLHQRKLEKLQSIKKAYLNEMFV
ncbi:restriction endonuclease subunit S [Heyndrickxia faecalis]|uniref:restriction endonuclease subunit S n=1 Tax=Heyndrickxia faecalis TaxID=2824910 RepID=UPI003D21B3F5